MSVTITLAELAKLTQGELEGSPEFEITGANGLAEAGEKDASFLGNPKYAAQVASTKAGCVFLPKAAKGAVGPGPKNRIYVEDPQYAFSQLLGLIEFETAKRPAALIDKKAEVHYEAKLGPNVSVGAFTVLSARSYVGEGTILYPQVFVGANAVIGKGCKIYPQVVIRENCVIGDRVIIHSGTVIGSDGFGFSTDKKTGVHRKIPQIGNVVIEDDVEIGSNVSVDRATIGTTRIGAGTKIDNLVQIGHNVQIGKGCLIVSQVGISGSTKIGSYCVLAGQAGIIGHLNIGDGAVVTAQSGVINDVEPKAVIFGTPARPHREGMKLQALFGKLPEIYEIVKELKKKIGSETHS